MTTNISQDCLIEVINAYLKWNHLPIEWNDRGVCRGLATVHAKYCLEGKESLFFQMLEQLSQLNKTDLNMAALGQINENINDFITQVILAQKPGAFDSQYSQHQSYKLLSTVQNRLKATYNLALAASFDTWKTILEQDIQMQVEKIFLVSNISHDITVQKKEKGYTVYDPNAPQGIEYCQDEIDLLIYLALVCFSACPPGVEYSQVNYRDLNLGLVFTKITNQTSESELERKSAVEIYQKYSKQILLSGTFYSFGDIKPCSDLMNDNDSDELIEYLINEKKISYGKLEELLSLAILNNQSIEKVESLKKLIIRKKTPQEAEAYHKELIFKATIWGNFQYFNYLCQHMGVRLDSSIQAIIKQKSHYQLSNIEYLGVQLYSFTSYLKYLFGFEKSIVSKKVEQNINQFRFIKKLNQTLKDEDKAYQAESNFNSTNELQSIIF